MIISIINEIGRGRIELLQITILFLVQQKHFRFDGCERDHKGGYGDGGCTVMERGRGMDRHFFSGEICGEILAGKASHAAWSR